MICLNAYYCSLQETKHEELDLCHYSKVIDTASHFLKPFEAVLTVIKARLRITQRIINYHSHAGEVDDKALVVLPAIQILRLLRVSCRTHVGSGLVQPYGVCVVLVSAVVGPGHVLHVIVRARTTVLALRVPGGDVDVGRSVWQEGAAEGSAPADSNTHGVLLHHFHFLTEGLSVVHEVVNIYLELLSDLLRHIFPIESDSIHPAAAAFVDHQNTLLFRPVEGIEPHTVHKLLHETAPRVGMVDSGRAVQLAASHEQKLVAYDIRMIEKLWGPWWEVFSHIT